MRALGEKCKEARISVRVRKSRWWSSSIWK